MNETQLKKPSSELTAVDDARQIRRQFQEESGGNLDKHVEQSNRVLEELRQSSA